MKRRALSSIAAFWLALLTGPATALTCDVEFSRNGDFVTIQGLVQTDRAATVNYIVRVETRSAAGVSLSQQGGSIDVSGGSTQVPLSRSVINIRPDATVVVDVEVSADGATASCTAETVLTDEQEL